MSQIFNILKLDLDETDCSPDEPAPEIAHARRTALGPVALHPRERILHVLRTQRSPSFGRGEEQ